MKTRILEVYDVGGGQRVVKADTSQDIAVGVLESMRVIAKMEDTPAELRKLATMWIEAFNQWLGMIGADSHDPEVRIMRPRRWS